MRGHLITAKPSRLWRALMGLRTCTVRLAALLVMVLLGAVAFPLRCCRPVINYLATRAAWLELWAASITGIGPISTGIGAGLTDELIREFHRARTGATTH